MPLHTPAETRLQPLLGLLKRLEDSLLRLKDWKRRLDGQAAGPAGPAAPPPSGAATAGRIPVTHPKPPARNTPA